MIVGRRRLDVRRCHRKCGENGPDTGDREERWWTENSSHGSSYTLSLPRPHVKHLPARALERMAFDRRQLRLPVSRGKVPRIEPA